MKQAKVTRLGPGGEVINLIEALSAQLIQRVGRVRSHFLEAGR